MPDVPVEVGEVGVTDVIEDEHIKTPWKQRMSAISNQHLKTKQWLGGP